MTLDRALELAEAALYKDRRNRPSRERAELDEALTRIAKLRITTQRTGR